MNAPTEPPAPGKVEPFDESAEMGNAGYSLNPMRFLLKVEPSAYRSGASNLMLHIYL